METANLTGVLTTAFLLCSGTIVESQSTRTDAFELGVEAVRAGKILEAYEHFEPLAFAGNHRAQFNMATLLKSGRGKPQNYTEALKWAILAHIGGISRAAELTEALTQFVPEAELETVREEVQTQLLRLLDEGNREAILQYARFNLDFLAEPDFQIALRWQLIAAALDINGASELRDQTAEQMIPEDVLLVQQETSELFKTDDLAARFAVKTD